jgi:hypothetical protein
MEYIEEKVKVITLCGSLRFINEMKVIQRRLVDKGFVCFMPEVDSRKLLQEPVPISIFQSIHNEKMRQSDAILIVNVNGYIGDNTRDEIQYAHSIKKKVYYLNNTKDGECCPDYIKSLLIDHYSPDLIFKFIEFLSNPEDEDQESEENVDIRFK